MANFDYALTGIGGGAFAGPKDDKGTLQVGDQSFLFRSPKTIKPVIHSGWWPGTGKVAVGTGALVVTGLLAYWLYKKYK